MPIDYSKGKIYKIYSPSHLEIGEYIGSTIQPLSARLATHRYKYKLYKEGKHHYITSFDLLDFKDIRIELIENYKCSSKEELLRKEGESIRGSGKCVNHHIAGRTPEEYREENRDEINRKGRESQKKYRRENHDKEIERHRKYNQEHREEHIAYCREYRKKKKEEKLRNSVESMTLM